jgi:NAD(P)-dependent dehydrogenase (short-subunit alcohol dehydrogenase family)
MEPTSRDGERRNMGPTKNKELIDHVVLITGAGRGLGHGVARGLARLGATVIAVSRTKSELDELEGAVLELSGTIDTYPVDLASRNETDEFITSIRDKYGGVSALINNAAVLRMKPFAELSEEEFDQTIEINLQSPVRLIRAFLPEMANRGAGAIINVSSAAGVRGFTDETDYCASKFGLEGFSYALAKEVQAQNISVNLMSPGYRIKPTSVTAAEFASWPEAKKSEFRDPIDMADGFAFLCLQDGSGLTGQRFDAYELSERVRNDGWNWHRSGAGIE